MRSYHNNDISIKNWAVEDRPREKMYNQGKQKLTNAELLAIILGSGNRQESAVSLAQRILHSVDYNLHAVGQLSIKELTQFKGIGQAKAIAVEAALELGRRRQLSQDSNHIIISDSSDAFRVIAPQLLDLDHEEFWILFLNRRNKLLGKSLVSRGGASGTFVDPKIIFRKTLQTKATSIILAHNHPSGTLRPSRADILLTQKLMKGGASLDIIIHDHIIVAGNSHYSFAKNDLMKK